MKIGDIFYRYDAFVTFYAASTFTLEDPELNARAHLELSEWVCTKVTPKGGWVERWGERHLVIEGTNKAWAYPTVELAWNSFKIRAARRRQHWRNEGERIDAIEREIANCTPARTT